MTARRIQRTDLATAADWRQRDDVWRGRRSEASIPAVATGYPELDHWLPTQGWPLGSLCEILYEADGGGELSLLLPALAQMGSAQRPVIWVLPPHRPHAPALRQRQVALEALRVILGEPTQALWAAEQCLRAGCCSAVLVWPGQVGSNALRRLQLATETGRCHGFVFRDARHSVQASPAPLRLGVRRKGDRLQVRFDKCRGLLNPPSGFIDVSLMTGMHDTPSSSADREPGSMTGLESVPGIRAIGTGPAQAMRRLPHPTHSGQSARAGPSAIGQFNPSCSHVGMTTGIFPRAAASTSGHVPAPETGTVGTPLDIAAGEP